MVATVPSAGWTITDLGTLGGTYSQATGINAAGDVVGYSTNKNGDTHAFVWSKGKMTDLGTLGGTFSAPSGMNERGQVVGWSTTKSGQEHAFLWQRDRMTDLGTLGGTSSQATGINWQGEVVGGATTATGEPHAFLWKQWKNGTMRDLGVPYATAINDRGQVAVVALTATGDSNASVWQSGSPWQDGTLSDLGNLGYVPGYSFPRAMNQRGQVVGYSWAVSGSATRSSGSLASRWLISGRFVLIRWARATRWRSTPEVTSWAGR